MFNIILFQPEIPPNTGNIIRLCANTGCSLHLIEPLGFHLTDKHLRRAGLDHIHNIQIKRYDSLTQYLETVDTSRVFLCTTKASQIYTSVSFKPQDSFVFGSETKGLPNEILNNFSDKQKIKIPMISQSRSLNLSNAVAVIVYEGWRQLDILSPS